MDGNFGGPVLEAPDLEADGIAIRQAVPRAEDQPVFRLRFRDLELAAGLPEEALGIRFDFEIERPTLSAAGQDDLGGFQFLAGLRGADARHPSDARMKRHGDVAVDLRPVGRRVGFPEIFRKGVEQIDFLEVRRIERLHEVRIRHLPACPEPEEERTGDGVELELEPRCPPAHAVFAVLAGLEFEFDRGLLRKGGARPDAVHARRDREVVAARNDPSMVREVQNLDTDPLRPAHVLPNEPFQVDRSVVADFLERGDGAGDGRENEERPPRDGQYMAVYDHALEVDGGGGLFRVGDERLDELRRIELFVPFVLACELDGGDEAVLEFRVLPFDEKRQVVIGNADRETAEDLSPEDGQDP